MPLSLIIQQESNARINPAGDTEPSIQFSRMKSKLIPLGLNELLDFVHRRHSASPNLSPPILPFTATHAAGRFNPPQPDLGCLREAQTIQVGAPSNKNFSAQDL